ncbi:MAG TPA: DNA-directed RNA polymerase subunit beta [Tepidisphaeraceae bacterium]|jgi:DNA-directed RNA polymerase subunit beta|nr:DNA-directed RNA polymerase subunit beta [Tepidisphaeraceae bacterium]
MQVYEPRDFSKRGDTLPIPNLIDVQIESYQRFLQKNVADIKHRKNEGLESLLREVFPIESYDGNLRLEYISYDLSEPRYTPDECRALRLTYGMPFRIQVKFVRKDKDEVVEDSIYLGEIPIMIGGGEFIINGAERVIVNQLHRSPGVDFLVEVQEGDRPLHGCRVIPERGSWIECSVTKKDALAVRIDQSSKIPATTFLRALDAKYSTSEAIIKEFYPVENVKVGQLQAGYYAAAPIIDAESGEELVKSGAQIGEAINKIQASDLKSVSVVTKVADPLMLNTLGDDPAESHNDALLRIYARLRPGNPPQLDKAQTLFEEKFFDENRYRLGRVGRFRINRKFDQNVPETVMTLRSEDLVNSLKYMFKLRSGEGYIDDIDHLGNRRLRTIDELAGEELRKGFLKLKRTVQERMSLKDPNELGRIAELVNSKSISSSIDFFFGRGELSQVVDQTNPLSQLTHERRLSALGPGGLNRKRAGFEVRDVHISHYGRICPIETPEGTNIGLIASLAIYSDIDEYGFLITPYRVVEDGKVNGEHKYLRADEEMKAILGPPDVVEKDGQLRKGLVLARVQGDLATVPSREVQYVDISPRQTVSVSAALIPFLEHDDANRALMGSNMQRQAVPLLRTDPPIISTGMERPVAQNSGMVVRAERGGVITYIDSSRILIDNADEYVLRKFVGLNERTCLNQKPIVRKGQRVKKGQIIADGAATHQGELALGRNVLVAFMTYDGYNFEDAIVISQRLVKEDVFTSIHIEEYDVEIRETKLGREEFTRDIPNVSERALANLDENGVVRVGTRVGPGDILVGKIAPKSKSELTPEEKLLHAIFGRAGEDVKNDSLEMPAGEEGVVINTQRFSRRMHMTDDQKKALKKDIDKYEKEMNQKAIGIFKQMVAEINEVAGQQMVDPSTRQKVGQSENADVILEQIEGFNPDWIKGNKEAKEQGLNTHSRFWPRVQAELKEKNRRMEHMKRGDELPSGVLEMVKVYVATKRQLSVGDKMAGRHGNKGVIARIVPEEDMPFLEDGTPVEILLNPLGVPSRMNVGQILETHLGWAMAVLGQQAITPVFDGATEDEIHAAIEQAGEAIRERRKERKSARKSLGERDLDVVMPWGGKVQLMDGRTGERFEQKTTVGYIYMMKLHHLVDDKIHARATGPYSLITQQPLGGKARTGGQRFGEMEVWGLEAYGASYVLQELLTVKSDDVEGRTKIYESMVKGTNTLEAGTPVSFDVLCNEIRGLGLNIQLEKKKGAGREEEDADLM